MSTTTLPTEPAVEIAVSRQNVLLPAAVRDLLLRGHCSLAEAARFLGLSVKPDGTAGSTAHTQAQRYRERMQALMFDEENRPRPYDPQELTPRMVRGKWVEIANSKSGVIRCDTRYLVAQVYPEIGMPA
jgi:hypothetical protein